MVLFKSLIALSFTWLLRHVFLLDLLFGIGDDKIELELELDIELADDNGGVGGELDAEEHDEDIKLLLVYWLCE